MNRAGLRSKPAKAPEVRQPDVSELILSHRENGRKLARSILRRWQVKMAAEEIDSIVDLTLCEAAPRYDVTKGASFITFLFYHLRGHLVRAVASATNETSIFHALAQSAGLDTTDWAIPETEDEAATNVMPDYLMNTHHGMEEPESLVIEKERSELYTAACEKLDELEQQVIDRSYAGDESLVDIAKSLGYSRCHISRVKKRALERLRSYISERTLEDLPAVEEDIDEGMASREGATERKHVVRRSRRRRIELPQKPEKIAAAG